MRSKWCKVAPFSLKCFFRGWSRCEGGDPARGREPGEAVRNLDRGGVKAMQSKRASLSATTVLRRA